MLHSSRWKWLSFVVLFSSSLSLASLHLASTSDETRTGSIPDSLLPVMGPELESGPLTHGVAPFGGAWAEVTIDSPGLVNFRAAGKRFDIYAWSVIDGLYHYGLILEDRDPLPGSNTQIVIRLYDPTRATLYNGGGTYRAHLGADGVIRIVARLL